MRGQAKENRQCGQPGCVKTFRVYWYDPKQFCSRSCGGAAGAVGRPRGKPSPAAAMPNDQADEVAQGCAQYLALFIPQGDFGPFFGGGKRRAEA